MVAALFVNSEFVRVTAPGPRAIRPPPVLAALPSNVDPDTANDEKLMASRPPPSEARLFVNDELLMLTAPLTPRRTPPFPLNARFPSNVESVIVTLPGPPAARAAPPPFAKFDSNVEAVMVSA